MVFPVLRVLITEPEHQQLRIGFQFFGDNIGKDLSLAVDFLFNLGDDTSSDSGFVECGGGDLSGFRAPGDEFFFQGRNAFKPSFQRTQLDSEKVGYFVIGHSGGGHIFNHAPQDRTGPVVGSFTAPVNDNFFWHFFSFTHAPPTSDRSRIPTRQPRHEGRPFGRRPHRFPRFLRWVPGLPGRRLCSRRRSG